MDIYHNDVRLNVSLRSFNGQIEFKSGLKLPLRLVWVNQFPKNLEGQYQHDLHQMNMQ